jgi:hypothetical protein
LRGKRVKRLHAAAKLAQGPGKLGRAKRALLFATPIALLAGIGVIVDVTFLRGNSSRSPAAGVPTPVRFVRKAQSLAELLEMSPDQLKDIDIAERNLLCATGLPGAEKLDIGRCLARLDEWAAKARYETRRHLYRAHDPKWADHYKHSENWLRAEFLAQVLQEDCGVHYNPERVRNIDFTKSQDLFIHGMIDDANGGTCSSMPVLYVAVGRRLGYPLKLVLAKAHVFARWDDGHERFNIETTSNGETGSYPDEHYRNWPEKWTPAEARANRYLISLSPAEELASFLGNRGHCLLDNGHAKEALDVYAAARKLAPQDPASLSWMRQARARLRPPVLDDNGTRPPRRGPDMHQNDPLAEIDRMNAMNRAKIGPSWPQTPGGPRPPSPDGPRPPQPGAPDPYQPRQPPIPGQPPK